jgi:hypothetical protein
VVPKRKKESSKKITILSIMFCFEFSWQQPPSSTDPGFRSGFRKREKIIPYQKTPNWSTKIIRLTLYNSMGFQVLVFL